MRVVMDVDGSGGVVTQLHADLRRRPGLAQVDVRRGRAEVGEGELGAGEVLTFLATEVSLPLVLNAVYDFFRDRRRSQRAEQVRVRLTRTDLPDGTRTVDFELHGPADAAVSAVRAAFGEFGSGE
jgi:hypothetical protein